LHDKRAIGSTTIKLSFASKRTWVKWIGFVDMPI